MSPRMAMACAADSEIETQDLVVPSFISALVGQFPEYDPCAAYKFPKIGRAHV